MPDDATLSPAEIDARNNAVYEELQRERATEPDENDLEAQLSREAIEAEAAIEAAYESAWKSLNTRQRVFVETYVATFNGTKAAVAAEYSPKTAPQIASRLLKVPAIRTCIDYRINDGRMGENEAMKHLTEFARGTMEDFLSFVQSVDENGTALFDADGNPKMAAMIDLWKAKENGALHLLKEYKVAANFVSIKLYPRDNAVNTILRVLGAFGSEPDWDKLIPVEKLTVEQARRIANGEHPLTVLLPK